MEYKLSVNKWKKIIKTLETYLKNKEKRLLRYDGTKLILSDPKDISPIEAYVVKTCGFCYAFKTEKENEEDDNDGCKECPLFSDYCSNDGAINPIPIFWKVHSKLSTGDFNTALSYAKDMLEEIESTPYIKEKKINAKKKPTAKSRV